MSAENNAWKVQRIVGRMPLNKSLPILDVAEEVGVTRNIAQDTLKLMACVSQVAGTGGSGPNKKTTVVRTAIPGPICKECYFSKDRTSGCALILRVADLEVMISDLL